MRQERTLLLIGEEGLERLKKAKVLLFGVGGVGGYALEALVRSGVGTIGIVDGDIVVESNLNRQLIATEKTIGKKKCDAAAMRAQEVDSRVEIKTYPFFYNEDNADKVPIEEYDYVVDAIDDVPAKTDIIKRAVRSGTPVISVMGTGNKLSPDKLTVADISKTEICPLARAVRVGLRKEGVTKGVKAVFSKELPRSFGGKIGSTAFVPATAGMIAASEVVKDICRIS